jgi:hypothetical protein
MNKDQTPIGRTRLGHRTALKVRANDWDPIRAEH